MAAGDLYHISGSISPSRRAVAFLGGNVDDGVQVDAFAAARTAAADIILTPNYSEFTSRLRHSLAAAPVVADTVAISVNEQMGHAIVIKAA